MRRTGSGVINVNDLLNASSGGSGGLKSAFGLRSEYSVKEGEKDAVVVDTSGNVTKVKEDGLPQVTEDTKKEVRACVVATRRPVTFPCGADDACRWLNRSCRRRSTR